MQIYLLYKNREIMGIIKEKRLRSHYEKNRYISRDYLGSIEHAHANHCPATNYAPNSSG